MPVALQHVTYDNRRLTWCEASRISWTTALESGLRGHEITMNPTNVNSLSTSSRLSSRTCRAIQYMIMPSNDSETCRAIHYMIMPSNDSVSHTYKHLRQHSCFMWLMSMAYGAILTLHSCPLLICIWSSWCHCHPIISCFSKIQNGLPFWCRLTQVVLEKRPLNKRVCLCVCVRVCVCDSYPLLHFPTFHHFYVYYVKLHLTKLFY